jgi:4-amino-4-deoxy-L-arabinose transferase-like glycosyltransferase
MNLILIAIILLASFIRLFALGDTPISLFGDEVDVGYHAWSLITTGRDYMGNLLPTYIQSLSESRAPLLMYAVAPFVGLFGPSTLSVRLAPALFGILSVVLIYVVTHRLFPKIIYQLGKFQINLGHLSAFLLAMTPWHIMYSRTAFESTLLLALILLGLYLYLSKRYVLSFVSFALTLYAYSTATVFTPLFVALTIWALWHSHRPQLKHLILPFIILIPIAIQILFGQASGRFGLISIFNNTDIIDSVVLSRTQAWSEPSHTLLQNKYVAISSTFVKNYVSALSPQFLFVSGDSYPRHHTGFGGQLLIITLPLFLIGLYQSVGYKRLGIYLLLWLLISPIPSALTNVGGMHATRLFLMLPPLIIITSLGTYRLITSIRHSTLIFMALSSLLILNLALFLFHYLSIWRYESWKFFRPEFSQAFSQISQYDTGQNYIYFNNTYEPSLLQFAFYKPILPAVFHRDFVTDQPDSYQTDYFFGFRLGQRYFFGQAHSFEDMINMMRSGDLYLAVQGIDIPGDWDLMTSPVQGIEVVHQTYSTEDHLLFSLLRKL